MAGVRMEDIMIAINELSGQIKDAQTKVTNTEPRVTNSNKYRDGIAGSETRYSYNES
ncbi:hypothetical protein KFZ58_13335 [Virgibacillus sp. NKC19-16]|uniref:hypothetical protein n=1 Tax=Virgibacillus salidurans TaxID=2831673 RepID=UPI001F204837|nr:hypothetical protein [Virgibacillus sp. NKC19-16]UJL45385.1 hypothetical protein KFZ58_13335 [Virgibacillus sp. NKC19-16]